MSKILIVGEHAEGKLNAGVGKVVAAAQGIGGDIEVVLFGDSLGEVASQAAALDGVAKVYTVERAENAKPMAAILAPQIVEIAKGGYSHVLFPGGTFGKDLAPRVSALLDVQQVSDIMAVHGATPSRIRPAIYWVASSGGIRPAKKTRKNNTPNAAIVNGLISQFTTSVTISPLGRRPISWRLPKSTDTIIG